MKRSIKIGTKLSLIIFFTALIPVIGVTGFTTFRIFNHLQRKTASFYATLLGQVARNVDFTTIMYTETLDNLFSKPDVHNTLFKVKYKNKKDEVRYNRELIGELTVKGGIRNTIEERIEGQVFIYELDRPSLTNNTSYKTHYVSQGVSLPDIDILLLSPFYQTLKSEKGLSLIIGKPEKGLLKGFEGDIRSFMLYPVYKNKKDKKKGVFNKFLIINLFTDFFPSFVMEIENLHFGTLYIIDRFGTIVSTNHPNSDLDDYTYDEELGKYILEEGDNPIDPYAIMPFSDYKQLVTGPDILLNPDIQTILNSGEERGSVQITIEKQRFLMVTESASDSGIRFVYFHPMSHIFKPIIMINVVILAVVIGMIILAIIISLTFSRTFTRPIHNLVKGTYEVSQGHFQRLIEVNSHDELADLSNNFNSMLRDLKAFQDRLLTIEREKVEMDLASRIQTSLVPKSPNMDTYEIKARMIPAEEVGGDYYDMIVGETEGSIWLGIGDVSGHGLASGLIMMMAQTAFNTLIINYPDLHPDDLIRKVNKVIYQNVQNRLGEDDFMTLSFLYASGDGEIRFSGAHLDILVWRIQTRKVERIHTVDTGLWLGILPDIETKMIERSFKLNQGDLMFLYTDGLIESMNEKNEQFNMDRLIADIEQNGHTSLDNIEQLIITHVFDFLHEQTDDISFVIVRKL